jgi:hypothetical protein
MAGAANRCVIPEHAFEVDHLVELLVQDRQANPSRYSVVLISEGATFRGQGDMAFEGGEADMFGHRKLGGIGEKLAAVIKDRSAHFNNNRRINVIYQKLGYLVRCGDPDSVDAIVPMAFGNIAMDLVTQGASGRLVCVRRGAYDHVPVSSVTSSKKLVDVSTPLQPRAPAAVYRDFLGSPVFIMTGGMIPHRPDSIDPTTTAGFPRDRRRTCLQQGPIMLDIKRIRTEAEDLQRRINTKNAQCGLQPRSLSWTKTPYPDRARWRP